MRTSFVVGIFAFAVAVVGSVEWASRHTGGAAVQRTATAAGQRPPAADARQPEASLTPPDAAPLAAHPAPADTLVLAEGRGGFRLNGVSLSDDARAEIDAFMSAFGPEPVGVQFVIEGHTDNLGSEAVNQKIGLARALAVRQYLAEAYGLEPSQVHVASFGSSQPVADNATQEGRTRNRRVVIRASE
jgi:OOP family OmpA-OmpF porin